jgi:hypothetical protein
VNKKFGVPESYPSRAVLVTQIDFCLKLLANTVDSYRLDGYLFVCPAQDLQAGTASFRWPDCPAYWSLDPSGVDRLTVEDAKILGFPAIHIETRIRGVCWHDSVYTTLRRFHQAKGFNTEGQDVAKTLGYPLYELSNWMDGPFAYGESS